MYIYSFIIPVYNADKYLRKCIESLVHQEGTHENFEVILVDDGSNDKSGLICKEYENIYENIKYYKKSNEGVSIARNYGIDKASGKYFIFVDSDDIVDKSLLSTIEKNIKENDLLIYGYYKMYKNKNVRFCIEDAKNAQEIKEMIYTTGRVSGYLWNKIFRADIIKNNGIMFNSKIHFSEDLLFIDQYLRYVKNIFHENKALYYYRMRRSSVTFNYYNERSLSVLDCIEQLIKNNENNTEICEHLEFRYIKNYYRLRKIIKKTGYPINNTYLEKEKYLISQKSIKEKVLYYLSKYNYRAYLIIKGFKNIKDKLYE